MCSLTTFGVLYVIHAVSDVGLSQEPTKMKAILAMHLPEQTCCVTVLEQTEAPRKLRIRGIAQHCPSIRAFVERRRSVEFATRTYLGALQT